MMASKMVTQGQQEQVQAALKDAISRICQNGFSFRSSLSIQAEVVVLVDDQDMLSLSIRDQVTNGQKHTNPEFHWGNQPNDAMPRHAESSILQSMKSEVADSWTEGATNWQNSWDPNSSVEVESDAPACTTGKSGIATDSGSDIITPIVALNDSRESQPSSELETEKSTSLEIVDISQGAVQDDPMVHSGEESVDHGGVNHQNEDTTLATRNIADDHDNAESPNSDDHDESIELRKGADVRTVDIQKCKNGDIYQCPYCEFCTPHGSALSIHLTVHTKVKMQCKECDQEFTCISKLKKHMKIQHKMQKHICSFCNAELSSRQSLSMHRKVVHGYKKVRSKQCPYCEFKSNHAGNMSRHIRSHTGVKFKCDYCEKSYTDRNTLKTHTIKAHFGDTLSCDVCQERFVGLMALMEHEKKVHGFSSGISSARLADFECSSCNFKTFSSQAFNRHIMKDNDDLLVCKVCKEKCACKAKLKSHMAEHHPQENQQAREVCEFCSKVFYSFQGLYTHRKVIHSDELDESERKIYTCHICGKTFPVYAYLTRHLKSHDSTEPYQCPKCLRTFKYHRNFKTHKEGCMNTDGYPCHICGKSMKTEYTLNIHIKGMHTEEKVSYPCRTCGQLFHHKNARRKHEKRCFVPVLPPMYNPFQMQ